MKHVEGLLTHAETRRIGHGRTFEVEALRSLVVWGVNRPPRPQTWHYCPWDLLESIAAKILSSSPGQGKQQSNWPMEQDSHSEPDTDMWWFVFK